MLQSQAVNQDEAFEMFNRLDGYAPLRGALKQVAARDRSWAGIPLPIEGMRLRIHPKFPKAAELSDIGVTAAQRSAEEALAAKYPDTKIRNSFWSHHRKAQVIVYEEQGKVGFVLHRGTNPATRMLDTLMCSHAWGLEQESRAIQTLGTLLRHHIFKSYLLTGMFLETSKRTGLTYVFRRLRPTVVIDAKVPEGQSIRVRCALCMHPIAHYEDTWAGAMTPTDDVIAALMMMRGDEPMFWRRSTQHPPWEPNAGIW